jgi:hypothetical protein
MTPRQREIMDALDMVSAMRPPPTNAELVYLLHQKIPGVRPAEAEEAIRAYKAMIMHRHGHWGVWLVSVGAWVWGALERLRGQGR